MSIANTKKVEICNWRLWFRRFYTLPKDNTIVGLFKHVEQKKQSYRPLISPPSTF